MSESAGKTFRGLQEAYTSIYTDKSENLTEDTIVSEHLIEDLEVDPYLLVDVLTERLVLEGYANTEDQALNMIPHMSDAWLDTVVGNFVLEESFIDAVNSLLEEGYDLSSYTVDDLFEDYIGHFNNCLTEDYRMDLHEAVPLLAAPLLANPATWAAGAGLAAGIGYAGKKLLDAWNQRRSGTDAASERWLQTGSYASTKEKPKPKPTQDNRRLQQAAERLKARQPQPQSGSKPQEVKPKVQPPKPSELPAGSMSPRPPQGPGPFEKAKALVKKGMGLKPGQSLTREIGKGGLETAGKVIRGTWNAPGGIWRNLPGKGVIKKGLSAGGLFSAGAVTTGGGGKLVTGAGQVLSGAGGALQGAPGEAGAIKQGFDAYRKAKEEEEKNKNKPKPETQQQTGGGWSSVPSRTPQ